MDLYDKANSFLSNGQLNEAVFYFKLYIKKEGHSAPEKIIPFYEKILIISEQGHNIQETIAFTLEFIDYLIKIENFDRTTPYLKKLTLYIENGHLQKEKGQIYKKIIHCWEKNGNLDEVMKVTYECLDYFLKRGNASQGLVLSEELSSKYKNISKLKYFNLKFYILQNHFQKIDENIDIVLKDLELSETTLEKDGININDVLQDLLDLVQQKYSDDKNSIAIKRLIIRGLFEKLKREHQESDKSFNRSILSKLLNLIVEGILVSPKHLPIFFQAAKFYYLNGMKTKSIKFIQFIHEKRKDGSYTDFQKIEYNFDSFRKKVESSQGLDKEFIEEAYPLMSMGEMAKTAKEIDLASDLFQNNHISTNLTVKSLEKDIQSLFKNAKYKEMIFMMKELGQIDPKNVILQLYTSKLESINYRVVQNDIIYKNLLSDISNFCSSEKNHEKNCVGSDEINFFKKSYIEYYKVEDINNFKENFRDLVLAFNTLDMCDVSLIILDRVEKEVSHTDKFSLKEFCISSKNDYELKIILEGQYLKIITYIEQKNHYEALSIAECINKYFPLEKEEVLCFLYLEAEILRSLNKTKMALKRYKKIEKIDIHYRMTKERLKEFEKNK